MIRLRSPKNVLAGLLFLGFAGLIAHQASQLEAGTASRMGPGYFPMLLAQILGLLGLAILTSGFRTNGPALPRADWTGLGLVTAAVLSFGFLLERAGFLAAVFVSAALCVAASRPVRLIPSIALVGGLIVFCVAVFVWGLKIPVQLIR
jgi:putative tricarboxylic transport membrane protein